MFDDLYLYLCPGEMSCFDNDGGDGDKGGDGGQVGDGGHVGEGGQGGDGGESGEGGDGDRTFTQDDVNRIVEERLARDRKKNEDKYRHLESQ